MYHLSEHDRYFKALRESVQDDTLILRAIKQDLLSEEETALLVAVERTYNIPAVFVLKRVMNEIAGIVVPANAWGWFCRNLEPCVEQMLKWKSGEIKNLDFKRWVELQSLK